MRRYLTEIFENAAMRLGEGCSQLSVEGRRADVGDWRYGHVEDLVFMQFAVNAGSAGSTVNAHAVQFLCVWLNDVQRAALAPLVPKQSASAHFYFRASRRSRHSLSLCHRLSTSPHVTLRYVKFDVFDLSMRKFKLLKDFCFHNK